MEVSVMSAIAIAYVVRIYSAKIRARWRALRNYFRDVDIIYHRIYG
jgi:hypothetical protein